MGDRTGIEWTDATWNPVTGCTRVSEGCRHCYAARLTAGRLAHQPRYKGLAFRTKGPAIWANQVRLHEGLLEQPLRWRKPRMVFVCSMSDLFHPKVPFAFIDGVFTIMAVALRHTFQILTKRPERMAEYLASSGEAPENVWLGTSVEDQAAADERIPHLLRCPAEVRFLSAEPLLGPIDLRLEDCWIPEDHYELWERLHWVIAGGETGPGARPVDPDWLRSIRDQCRATDVSFFLKQLGPDKKAGRALDGELWDQVPATGVRP